MPALISTAMAAPAANGDRIPGLTTSNIHALIQRWQIEFNIGQILIQRPVVSPETTHGITYRRIGLLVRSPGQLTGQTTIILAVNIAYRPARRTITGIAGIGRKGMAAV